MCHCRFMCTGMWPTSIPARYLSQVVRAPNPNNAPSKASMLGAETLKLPNNCAEDLHEPGGELSATNAAAVPAKGTASLEIIGATEEVATANAEALEPRAWVRPGQGEAERGLDPAARKDAPD